jgi:hypothetical protein
MQTLQRNIKASTESPGKVESHDKGHVVRPSRKVKPMADKATLRAPATEKFQFLTVAEFNKLLRDDKVTYIERAIAAILEKYGDFTEQSLFADGPPAPPPFISIPRRK